MTLPVSASIKSRASARAGATPVKDPARAAPAAAASAQKRDGFCRKGTICGPVFRFRNQTGYQRDDGEFYPIACANAKVPAERSPGPYAARPTIKRPSKCLRKRPKFGEGEFHDRLHDRLGSHAL